MAPKLTRSTLRLLALLAALPAAVLVLGAVYMLGMTYLEGNPRGFLASVEWASETLTTTGYGADSRWQHPVMVVFVMLTQIAGLFLVFLIFPIYVLPFFEERFEARLARALPPMDGRVLVPPLWAGRGLPDRGTGAGPGPLRDPGGRPDPGPQPA